MGEGGALCGGSGQGTMGVGSGKNGETKVNLESVACGMASGMDPPGLHGVEHLSNWQGSQLSELQMRTATHLAPDLTCSDALVRLLLLRGGLRRAGRAATHAACLTSARPLRCCARGRALLLLLLRWRRARSKAWLDA